MPLLEVEGLTAGYGEAVVLEEMGLTVGEGEGLAVLGRNGVGKTTLMLAIMGHAKCFRWSAALERARFRHQCTWDRVANGAGLGAAGTRHLFHRFTVEENLLVTQRPGRFDLAEIYRLFPRLKERRRNMGDKLGWRATDACDRPNPNHKPAIIITSMSHSKGWLLSLSRELEDTLRRLRIESGFAIILVEQHAEDALRLSDRAIVLDRGKIVLEGRSADLLADFGRVRPWITV